MLWNNIDRNRSILAHDDAEHWWARLGGQIASGAIIRGGSIEGVGAEAAAATLRAGGSRFAARIAAKAAVRNRLAIVGAAEVGAAGFGGREGSAVQRVPSALAGAGIGAAGGVALGAVAPYVSRGVSRLRGRGSDLTPERAPRDVPPPEAVSTWDDFPDAPRETDRIDTGATPPAHERDVIQVPSSPLIGDASSAPLLDTSAPSRPAPPAKALDDVLPEVERWASERGAQRHQDGAYPDVMLHGSPRPDIQEFDPYGRGGYGLFGAGTYLTDTASIAASYSKKGMSRAAREAATDQTLYAVRQAVKNPLDMDAPADRQKWESVAQRVLSGSGERYFDDLPEGPTNERFWRDVEDFLSGEQVTTGEGQETIAALVRSLGHDGITHIGGGRVNKEGARRRVVIALDPEQTEIVDRLSVGSLMQPPAPRSPDWIDANAGVQPARRRDWLAMQAEPTPARVASSDDRPDAVGQAGAEPTPARVASSDSSQLVPASAGAHASSSSILGGSPPLRPTRTAATLNEARDHALDFVGQPIRNEATGVEATVSGSTLKKLTSGKVVGKSSSEDDHALAVANVDDLFRRATLVERNPDDRGEPTIAAVSRWHAPLETPRGVRMARITVKETTSPKQPNPLYTVETVEIEGGGARLGAEASAPGQNRIAAPTGSVSGIAGDAPAGNGALDPPLGRTRRMDQPASAADMADLARSSSPEDVRPLPGNTIDSLHEAMRANPGTFRDMVPPKERSLLPVFTPASGKRPRRDPIDLIGWLRANSGVKDSGGDLRHLGIDNKPRPIEFAESEHSLGRLIDNEKGMPLDDSALRAWEAGYSERPTVNEMIDAMDETHRGGSGRMFHPDDLSGLKGKIIRTPTRALSAGNELFKAIARRMETAELAVRDVNREGLKGAALKGRIADLTAIRAMKRWNALSNMGGTSPFKARSGRSARRCPVCRNRIRR